jgi:hypothetical protein
MKRTIVWVVAILACAGGAMFVVSAQGEQGMMDGNRPMMQKGMGMMGEHKGTMEPNSMMMEKCMTMMHEKGMEHMAMHPMMHSQMVATSHGGVIIMIGPKLLKYDKDLNLVKETEIKIDWQAWRKSMMEHRKAMMEHHTMMQKEEETK